MRQQGELNLRLISVKNNPAEKGKRKGLQLTWIGFLIQFTAVSVTVVPVQV